MQFADMNGDLHTDILAVDRARKNVIIHIYDPEFKNYTQKFFFKPSEGCEKITNLAVGSAMQSLRLFVTCIDQGKRTILTMYDRNLNNEYERRKQIEKQLDDIEASKSGHTAPVSEDKNIT